jgi:hypothetical protein
MKHDEADFRTVDFKQRAQTRERQQQHNRHTGTTRVQHGPQLFCLMTVATLSHEGRRQRGNKSETSSNSGKLSLLVRLFA